jgi:hypothetical protein
MKWPEDFKPIRKVEKILQDKVNYFKQKIKLTGPLENYLLTEVYCLMEKM